MFKNFKNGHSLLQGPERGFELQCQHWYVPPNLCNGTVTGQHPRKSDIP